MKKLILGLAIGIGAVYLYKKLEKDGCLDDDCDRANRFISRARKGFRNAVDSGANEVEYLRERGEHHIRKGKEKLDELMG